MNDCKSDWTDQQAPGVSWRMPEELAQIAREGGAEVIAELFAIFQEDSAVRLEALCSAIASRDFDAMRGQAHSLKGSASQIGARPLAALCQQMEQLARDGTAPEQKALFVEMEKTFSRVKEQLSALDLQNPSLPGRKSVDEARNRKSKPA